MNTADKMKYLDALQECVTIAVKNGYTREQVANDILLLSTPPHTEIDVRVKLEF